MGHASIPEDPYHKELQVVSVSNSETLLLKPQRLLVLPLPVMELSEHVEVEPFTTFLPGLSADPQRCFKTVSGLFEFASHGVDLGDDKEARR
jgi:hypothetical protein